MIVHLPKEEAKLIRRQLLTDIVYAISHSALKPMNPEYTHLSPIEIYVSAQEFAKTIIRLSDVDEGLEDEMDDLFEEAKNENDAMFILVLAAIMLQAVDQKNPTKKTKNTIIKIFKRCQDNPLYMPLLEQFAHQEEERYAEGKITNLVDYELQEIERDKDADAIRTVIKALITDADKFGTDNINALIVKLNKFNLDNNHVIDEELKQLYDKLHYSTIKIGEVKELVMNKHVQNEVQNVEPGATGIVNK